MTRKLRVLHCLETVGSGGVEQRRLSLAQHLDSDRYEQRLVCTQAIGGLPELLEQAGCSINTVGRFHGIFDQKRYRTTLEIIREFRPHIIHGAVYEGVALAAVCGRLGRVPVVLGEETSDPSNRRWKGHLLYRSFAGLCHHMVGVSPAVTDYLRRKIRLPVHKVTLINNGVAEKPRANPQEIAAVRERLGLPQDAFVIGTVGRLLDSHKRASDLIRAMPRIIVDCPTAFLLVVGTGRDEQALQCLASELDVADQVLFASYQADTQPYYEVMDVFTMASAHEAFGLVLVEAMFTELPVVATRVGGIPGVVDDGATGFLVDPYQPQALAERILRLVNDPSARRAMGQAGRRRALSHFSSQRYVADVDALYRRLISARNIA